MSHAEWIRQTNLMFGAKAGRRAYARLEGYRLRTRCRPLLVARRPESSSTRGGLAWAPQHRFGIAPASTSLALQELEPAGAEVPASPARAACANSCACWVSLASGQGAVGATGRQSFIARIPKRRRARMVLDRDGQWYRRPLQCGVNVTAGVARSKVVAPRARSVLETIASPRCAMRARRPRPTVPRRTATWESMSTPRASRHFRARIRGCELPAHAANSESSPR